MCRRDVKLQKTVESSLPSLKATQVPEMITAHQEALARTIREARPQARPGDVFTAAALRGASPRQPHRARRAPHSAASRAYMQAGAPDPAMRLAVNAVYPDTEPITAISARAAGGVFRRCPSRSHTASWVGR